tara:strand:- start:101 stop:499 length:399 start_codon:yes stop_codon:yes gene_type:complete
MGGSDDSSNIVELTISEHADAHRKLYEEYNKQEDYLAWKALSAKIGKEEFHIERSRIGGINNKGNKQSKEHRDKRSKALKGKVYKHSPRGKETCKKISKALVGNKNFDINKPGVKEKHRQAMLKYWEQKKSK